MTHELTDQDRALMDERAERRARVQKLEITPRVREQMVGRALLKLEPQGPPAARALAPSEVMAKRLLPEVCAHYHEGEERVAYAREAVVGTRLDSLHALQASAAARSVWWSRVFKMFLGFSDVKPSVNVVAR